MRRTNRVEPINIGQNGNDLTRATMTTTTRMEFVRRVEVLPMGEAVARLHSDLNQSLAGEVAISPRIWTGGMQQVATPVAVRGSRRSIWCIGCCFITVGLLALCGIIAGLTIAFRNTNDIGESGIERYDVGDLHYGMNDVDTAKFPSSTYLSSNNKMVVQNYLSNQLLDESGYRGLFIDGVLVQQQSTNNRRRRDTSCDALFIIQNIQVYFDYCSTCTGSRNLALRRSLGNLTAFQQPLNLLINNGSMSKVSTQLCSAPTISSLIVPVRLSILQAQQINSSLLPIETYSTTPTEISSSYSTYIYPKRPTTGRSSNIFTSRSISTQKRRTTTSTTTTTLPPMETTLPIVTTIVNDISTAIFTTSSTITTDGTPTTEFTIIQTSSEQTETTTAFNNIDRTISSTDSMTTSSGTIDDMTTSVQELKETSASQQTTLSSDETSTYNTDFTSPSTESFSTEFHEITLPSSASPTDLSSKETSTSNIMDNTTISEEFETTSTDDLSTISQGEQQEETLLTTSLDDYSTVTSLISDSTTNTNNIDTSSSSSSLYDISTIEIQLSTVSDYTEETSLSPQHILTTIQPLTTKVQTSFKSKASTAGSSRQTTKKISPFPPYKSVFSTISIRNRSSQQTSGATSSFTSVKPGRTRKQTYYSTAFVSPTTQRYDTSRAITTTLPSVKPGRTRKQTYYSTVFASPTTQRYDTSRAITTTLPSVKPGRTRKQTYYSTALASPTTQRYDTSQAKTSTVKPGRTRKQTYYSTVFVSPTTQRYDTSRAITTTLPSVKPGRTRKQTYYSTAFVSPTTQRYDTSRAVTSTNIYGPTSAKRRGRLTTVVTPLASTSQTNVRAYTTMTLPLTTATQQRGRSKNTISKSKQTTYIPTSLPPRKTVLSTSTMKQYYTSLLTTDIMTTGSTIATNTDIETVKSTLSTESVSFSTTPTILIDLHTSTSSLNEDQTTEPLLTIDLISTTPNDISTDEPFIITSKLNTTSTTTTVVSTDGMTITRSLFANLTEQQRLYSSASTALSVNAYIESSSITTVLITHSSIQSTKEIDTKSSVLLETLFDTSFPTMNQIRTSTEDSSQSKLLITTISPIHDTKSTH
ncbi:unnamed protein product, partial [Adineta steineri]